MIIQIPVPTYQKIIRKNNNCNRKSDASTILPKTNINKNSIYNNMSDAIVNLQKKKRRKMMITMVSPMQKLKLSQMLVLTYRKRR